MGRGCLIYKPLLLSNPRFIHIDDSTMIRKGARMETIVLDEAQPPSLVIGKNVNIEQNVHLICSSRLAIGDGSVLSGSVYMNDCSHGLDPAAGLIMKQPLIHGGDVVIGKGCFLGIRSAIMPGVILGDHCVVGANSVVTKSFPAYSMVAGAPARLIRRYDHEKKAWV